MQRILLVSQAGQVQCEGQLIRFGDLFRLCDLVLNLFMLASTCGQGIVHGFDAAHGCIRTCGRFRRRFSR